LLTVFSVFEKKHNFDKVLHKTPVYLCDFSQEGISNDMKSSSNDNNLPVIVSVTGGYMEPAAAMEQPDFTQ